MRLSEVFFFDQKQLFENGVNGFSQMYEVFFCEKYTSMFTQ